MDLHYFELIAQSDKGRVLFVNWDNMVVNITYRFAKFELADLEWCIVLNSLVVDTFQRSYLLKLMLFNKLKSLTSTNNIVCSTISCYNERLSGSDAYLLSFSPSNRDIHFPKGIDWVFERPISCLRFTRSKW